MFEEEERLFARGITRIAGVDEAGRGPLAGPVVGAAVIIPRGYRFAQKIDDSKKLSPSQREKSFAEITAQCVFAHAAVGEEEIDRINILNASLKAMALAVGRLSIPPEHVLIDGPHAPQISFPCSVIIDGDAKSISIACASIVAKVIRDRIMLEYDKLYPRYGFAAHKGYGTKAHCQALSDFGPCPIHRRSFGRVKNATAEI